MRLTFFCGNPYRFDVVCSGGETRYYVVDMNDEENQTEEVPAETWDRLVRAAQTENIQFISASLDYRKLAAMGRIPSLVERVNDIARAMLTCEDCGHEHDDGEDVFPLKKKDEELS